MVLLIACARSDEARAGFCRFGTAVPCFPSSIWKASDAARVVCL